MSEVRELLLVKTSSMGDLVHTLSAVIEACERVEGLEIDWVCEESFADIARLAPQVKNVITLEQRRWRSSWWQPRSWAQAKRFIQRLKSKDYDLVIDAQGLMKSAWVTFAARAAEKVGFDRKTIREPIASSVLSRTVHAPASLHAIERLRKLFGQALGYEPQGPVRFFSGAHSASPEAAVLFLHGTSRPEKSWPNDQWVMLGKMLSAHGLKIKLPWANDKERLCAEKIAQLIGPQASCLAKMSLAALADELKKCKAAVGVDSGLMHLAAVLGCPTVAVMSAAHLPRFSSERFAPSWATHARIVKRSSEGNPIVAEDVYGAWQSLGQGA